MQRSTSFKTVRSRRGHEYFGGLIDEVRVYNRALSAAEIATDRDTPVGAP